MSNGALGSWEVARLARRWKCSRSFHLLCGWMLAYPAALFVVAARMGFAVIMVGGPAPLRALAAALVAICATLLALRTTYGHDGADQMATIICVAVALGYAVDDESARTIVLWFLAGQAALAYFAAGVAKAWSHVWRSGAALPGILSTQSYGYPRLGKELGGHRWLAYSLCWTTIVGECTFPLALLGVAPLTLGFLAWGATFHCCAAATMRLNTFLWAFVGTYPAVLFCTHIAL